MEPGWQAGRQIEQSEDDEQAGDADRGPEGRPEPLPEEAEARQQQPGPEPRPQPPLDDANLVADAPELPKTMLGREQLAWLKQTLAESDATWKIIVTSVPLAIPTGSPAAAGRDGWANFDQDTGFEAELLDLLTHLRDRNIHNVLFITTDVHFASVQRYTPFADAPDFQVYEYVTGPLNAGLFPSTALDTTLNPERLFFHGPASADAVTSLAEARRWFNFGEVAIDAEGVLTSRIRDADGRLLYQGIHAPR